jgi:collagen type III alpha
MVNGPMTNGVGMNPGMGGQQPPQQQLQPGMPPTSMNFAGMGVHPGGPPPPQPNGVPGPGGPQQPQPGQQMQFAMMPGQQRPMMNGMPPQRGGPNPNGGPPFQSPTMGHAHSPQHNPGIAPQQQGQPGQQPGQAPMAQLGNPGPSPHLMNRGMLPPPPQNGAPPPQTQTPGQQQGQVPQGQGPPTPGYQPQQQGGRPPSRTNTPRSGIMSHASPSLASRQPPPPGAQQQQGGAGPIPGGSREDAVNTEIMIIPTNMMNVLKQELGLGDKDLPLLSMNEKVCVFFFLVVLFNRLSILVQLDMHLYLFPS